MILDDTLGPQVTQIPISFSGAGDNVIVAGLLAKRIRVLQFFLVLGGKFVAVEYKAEGKIPTPRQLLTMKEIRKAGGIAIWGDSVERVMEELAKALGLP